MFDVLLILLFGLVPPILSLWLIHRLEVREHARLQQTLHNAATAPITAPVVTSTKVLLPADINYVTGIGYAIGNTNCIYNARSVYLRCAINPDGPCQDCSYFESHGQIGGNPESPI
ncbi:MAG: DUF6464 family protein [Pseudanabaenaceae cyanobacterium]|jgi:hypothetical protein